MSASRITDPRRLDVAAFTVAGAELAGEWPQSGFVRVAGATTPGAAAPAPVRWQVRGARAALEGAGVQPSLQIEADTEVMLECQRCLQPLPLPLHIGRRIFFVAGEDAAAALDATSDDDVLALVPSLDLHALIEDELLLALPLVPRHEACVLPLSSAAGAADVASKAEAEHPFAALAALKGRALPN